MTPLAKWTIVSVCLTALAVLVPWATYGDNDIELSRLPLWWTYAGAAAVMHACARIAPPVAAVFVVVEVVAAVVVATGYDQGSHVFDHVVPMVVPSPGAGVVFAVASAAAQGAGLRARARAARSVPA
ncbi:hypothetical protein FHX81_7219 [Saccharothrix saharensis]|uniref:SPW repeat-containing protein n=1 Tax=Saccharothrix saharensis TaxID=571190 RepID=A0A543JPH8_9PSEU|nr:hypothetical protein [Saccharothrix saharensis]TQM84762.1 hypothetical protein FHX81_7219 [Saccharothrix saharensis]